MIRATQAHSSSRNEVRYHFIMPVWNPAYVNRFVEVGLPAQLAPDNLPSLPANQCLYQIFTRGVDVERLRSAASFRKLEQLMPVSIETIDDMQLSNAYAAMTACYEAGIQKSRGVDTAFVFLTPDGIWSNGSFKNMHRLQQSGKRAILVAGLRMSEKQSIAQLKQQFFQPKDQSLSVSSRDLVGHCLNHLHPLSLAHLCEENGNRSLGHYYYRVGSHGLLARCVHIHPLMVRPLVSAQPMMTTLDHEYVRISCPNFEDVHVVDDSDEICGVEFSEPAHQSDMIRSDVIPESEVVDFMTIWTNSYHRKFLQHTMRFHAGEIVSVRMGRCTGEVRTKLVVGVFKALYNLPKWDGEESMLVTRHLLPKPAPTLRSRMKELVRGPYVPRLKKACKAVLRATVGPIYRPVRNRVLGNPCRIQSPC